MSSKPLLIIQTGSAQEVLPDLYARRGDGPRWIKDAGSFHDELVLTVKVFRGETLPKPQALKGVIITGSPAMVTDREPWSEYTASWIRDACKLPLPILGICYGHQLIAHALGGVVGFNPKSPEYGTQAVLKTLHAENDPLFHDLPVKLHMQMAHHQSVLRLPEGACLLASNRQDKHQAYRVGECVWGVQFHPEMDVDIIRTILLQDRTYYMHEGIDVDDVVKKLQESMHGKQLFDAFKKIINQKR